SLLLLCSLRLVRATLLPYTTLFRSVRDCMVGIPGMVQGKEVEVVFDEFSESSIQFLVRYWIQYKRQTDYVYAKSDAIMRIKKARSEEHTSELQSRENLVCRILLEKK